MQIGQMAAEQEVSLGDRFDFVTSQDVAAGESPTKDNFAYKIEGPKDYVVFIQGGTEFAPEFRDANGDPLDDSTRVTLQKCNRQGDPLSEYIVNEMLGRFKYEKMRNDPDFFRYTDRDLMLDEREIAKVYVEIPGGSNGFSAAESRLTIGDSTSDFGTPVEIIDHGKLSAEETAAVKAASQRGN